MPEPPHPTSGLLRRLAAGLYDGLLVVGLLVIPTLLAMALRGGEPIPPGNLLFQALLLATVAGFFTWFWSHGGQTLGMRAWRLRVEQQSGKPLTMAIALRRFGMGLLSLAAFGLGLWWILFDANKLAWHDRATGTRVVVLPQRKEKA